MTVRANASALPFPDGSIQCVVTSPPYFGKVAYGDDDVNEHGRGSLDSYVKEMVDVGLEMWRVTDDEAVFWLNLGDTMANSGGAGGDYNAGGRKDWKRKIKQGPTGLKGAQHCLAPERVVLGMQEAGWLVKRRIVWDKTPIVRPEDVNHVRRPLDAYEMIYMFVKGIKRKPYRYRPDAHRLLDIELGDVWHFAPERKRTGHQAPFPEELPRRCILLSTVHGDRVLDPYVGSGTTTRVANALGRVGIGTDLYARSE